MKILLTISGVLVLGGGLIAGVFEHRGVMWFSLLGLVACLIAANLDRIASFKASASGVEARTREVIQRAETAVTELRLLAAIVGEVALSLIKRSGRLGGYSDLEQEQLSQRILDVLRKVGVQERDIPQLMAEWHRFTEYDYVLYILGGHTVPVTLDPEITAEWKSLRSGGLAKIPTPDELRSFLDRRGFMTFEIAGYLEDYEYYRLHRSQRRSEVWRNREEWGRLGER
jgi:hypothetical protein